MPTYNLMNTKTKEEFEMFMSYSDLEKYLEENKHITQQLSAPAIVSGVAKKPDAGFRDVLKRIKRENSRGFKRSTVETF
jgi:hypothetical protein